MTSSVASLVLGAIALTARERPDAVALESRKLRLSYAQLHDAVQHLADRLRTLGVGTLALLADNGPAWALADLAAMQAGLCLVPLPPFFSERQRAHAMRSSGAGAMLLESSGAAAETLELFPGLDPLALRRVYGPGVALPAGTQKITYTSGTTGEPKGVCLAIEQMERVAQALCVASEARPGDVHLSVLPLSTLLENIGGLYAPLLAGATARLQPMREVGLAGASQLDVSVLVRALIESSATSTILVPQMLHALVAALEAGVPKPQTLRFVAVGGAPVSPRLLERAAQLGLPVYEGYGLSECSSVVALNRRGANQVGSVGRPLPHLRLDVSADGELRVSGNGYLGYVGETPRDPDAAVATGDLGYLDAEGFLHLSGRKKNMFVTAFGRNVAPEWVERELCLMPAIAQAAVFGEARPWNTALIVPRGSPKDVDRAIAEVNDGLPDYARVKRWIAVHDPFTADNGQLTANGRLRRAQIEALYSPQIQALYQE